MDTKISILFYSKKSRTTSDILLPIYLRVTISGLPSHGASTGWIGRSSRLPARG